MKFANEKSWPKVIVKTDSLTTRNLINKEEIENHSDKTLIEDCKKLNGAIHLEFVHILCEGNKCADYIFKLGRIQSEQTMRVMVLTNKLIQVLKANMQDVPYPRGD